MKMIFSKNTQTSTTSQEYGYMNVRSRIKCGMTGECGMTTKQGKNAAFTLAEVLIVITIIGVVAAITIPNIVSYFQDEQFKTAYKKTFSDLSNALNDANANYELESNTGGINTGANFAVIMSKLKIQKSCTSNNNSQCWDWSGEKYGNSFGGRPLSAAHAYIDVSGRAYSMMDAPTSAARFFFIDTNAFIKPNQWGKDRFVVLLLDSNRNNQDGIPINLVPAGDNTGSACDQNKCGTLGDKDYRTYFGTSWLYK